VASGYKTRFRYGHLPTQVLGDIPHPIGTRFSIWWKDIIGAGKGDEAECFKSHVRARVGNGVNIGFWNFKWIGNKAFSELYPSLYAKEEFPNVSVSERLGGNGESSLRSW
jgi:hypothetical protein